MRLVTSARAVELRDPINWVLSAQTQLRAAKLLNEKLQARFAGEGFTPKSDGGGTVDDLYVVDMDLFKPMYMLAGLSLELMFKGAIVRRDPACIDDSGQPDWQKSGQDGHSLRKLGERSQITGLDFGLLEKLEPFISWKGRYPSDRESFYEPSSPINFAGSHTSSVLDQVEKMFQAALGYIKART